VVHGVFFLSFFKGELSENLPSRPPPLSTGFCLLRLFPEMFSFRARSRRCSLSSVSFAQLICFTLKTMFRPRCVASGLAQLPLVLGGPPPPSFAFQPFFGFHWRYSFHHFLGPPFPSHCIFIFFSTLGLAPLSCFFRDVPPFSSVRSRFSSKLVSSCAQLAFAHPLLGNLIKFPGALSPFSFPPPLWFFEN